MDNNGGGSGGFPMPIRHSSRAFNDPSGSSASGGGSMMPSAERVVQPLAQYANSNGILLRPGGSREDGVGGGGGGGSRAQQPSHEVFMVREASRGSLGTSGTDQGRSPFATSGNRFQAEAGAESTATGDQQRQVMQQQQLTSSSHSSSHHRERSERDRDKERDHQQRQHLPLPKMLKIAVVGDSTSGKTAICNAFTSEGYNFSRNYHMTTGVSIYAKSIKLPSSRLGGGGGDGGELQSSISVPFGPEDPPNLLEPRINLVLVDSAGKPIYRELLPQYWDRLEGMVLVVDLTSSTALESALDWLNLAKGSMQKQKHVPPSNGSGDQSANSSSKRTGGAGDQSFLGVLIGSKTDLKDQRVISPKAAQDFASQHGLQYFECSAKENSGIEEPFFYLAHQWTSSSGGPADKENTVDGDVIGPHGGIFAMNRAGNNSSSNSTSKRSAFASRQGSSSEAF